MTRGTISHLTGGGFELYCYTFFLYSLEEEIQIILMALYYAKATIPSEGGIWQLVYFYLKKYMFISNNTVSHPIPWWFLLMSGRYKSVHQIIIVFSIGIKCGHLNRIVYTKKERKKKTGLPLLLVLLVAN